MWATQAQLIKDRNDYLEREAAFRSLFVNRGGAQRVRTRRGSRLWIRRRAQVAPPLPEAA